jgi:hypothetical protein
MMMTLVISLSLIIAVAIYSANRLRRQWLHSELNDIQKKQQDRLERLSSSCELIREDVKQLDCRMAQVETDLMQLTPVMGEDWGREDP